MTVAAWGRAWERERPTVLPVGRLARRVLGPPAQWRVCHVHTPGSSSGRGCRASKLAAAKQLKRERACTHLVPGVRVVRHVELRQRRVRKPAAQWACACERGSC